MHFNYRSIVFRRENLIWAQFKVPDPLITRICSGVYIKSQLAFFLLESGKIKQKCSWKLVHQIIDLVNWILTVA